MFRWLIRTRLTQEEAVQIARRFMSEQGFRVVDGPLGPLEKGFVCVGADRPSQRWYVRFRLHPDSSYVSTLDPLVVWVDSWTGIPAFPHLG